MKQVAQLLTAMRAAGVISEYALSGAVAQMRYTEPVATLDADVLVAVPLPESIDVLAPIHEFCAARGYALEGEAVRVGAWPLQFIPVFSALTRDALQHADTVEFEGVPFRVVPADYLAVIALSVIAAKIIPFQYPYVYNELHSPPRSLARFWCRGGTSCAAPAVPSDLPGGRRAAPPTRENRSPGESVPRGRLVEECRTVAN